MDRTANGDSHADPTAGGDASSKVYCSFVVVQVLRGYPQDDLVEGGRRSYQTELRLTDGPIDRFEVRRLGLIMPIELNNSLFVNRSFGDSVVQ